MSTHTFTYSNIHTLTHTHTLTHAHTHTHKLSLLNSLRRLFPEFYANNIRLRIPISSGVLMMIGCCHCTPPHVSFVC